MPDRCELCGRRFDRPGFYDECKASHSKPDLAERIANAIEQDVNDRRGLKWDGIDDERCDTIRDEWVRLIREEFLKP